MFGILGAISSDNVVVHRKQGFHWIGIADDTFEYVESSENLFYENPDRYSIDRRPPDLDETTFSDFIRGVRIRPTSAPTPSEQGQ